MPCSSVRVALLAKVTVDQVGQRGDRGFSLRTVRADRDRRSLADAKRQHAQNALCISNRAVLDHLDAGVLEARGGLDEKSSRAGVQTNLIGDGELSFR
jgi:hypothetical protein